MKRIVLIFVFFIFVFKIFAQQYPITIIPRVNAPAPVNLYNYADGTSLNSPLVVQLFLDDLTVNNRRIRLKTYFEGGNINFQSRDFVFGAEDLFIDGGVPITLRNTELSPYYKFENIQGVSRTVYGKSIPEGSYNFCFEVFDYLSGAKLSAKKCARVFIFKNEPPILNLPFNGSNIEPKDFENIVFQWTPRHLNVSNVEYNFSLVEIWDNHVSPQTAFLSQAPVYETTTRATSLVYGPDKPLLLSDKRYAWRVKAKALIGLEEIGLFKNDGFSEIFWFSRTIPCQFPENIYAEPKGTSKMNVFWDQDPAIYSEYIIAYREADDSNAKWFTRRTNSGWATIWGLKPNTTYEYKVKGKCIYQFSEYSQVQRVTTETIQNETANYNCGIVPDAVAISNRNPHPGLNIGDEISAGDFKVTIVEIKNQSNGIISGKGFVDVPYLNFAKFGVTFSNILVNSSNQLAQGEIVTLYDPELGKGDSVNVDIDIDISDGINGDGGVLDDVVNVDFVIDSIEIDANGAIVVTGTNGETAIVPGDEDINIVSTNGDVWSVGEDGTITKQEGTEGGVISNTNTTGIDNDGNVTSISATGVKVIFENSGYYYFDLLAEGTSTSFENEYKILNTDSGDYKVPYKAISDTKGEDYINARVTISDSNVSKEDIIFKTKDGAKIKVEEWNDDVAKLKLKRKYHYVDEEIYAVVKSKENPEKFDIAGSVITTHLASQKLEAISVTLIPVGNIRIDKSVKDKVEKIYSKAGVRLNIQEANKILPAEIYGWDIDNDSRLKIGDSSILSHYTDEEQVFNNYIKEQTYYNSKTYYVFVTDLPVSKTEVSGFMPLKRQFGYVFRRNANSIEKQARTLAHELGHGVFGLEHTWDEYKFPQGATSFLMDYGIGTILNHLDWKKMHAPGINLYWFQGDEEGENNNRHEDLINYEVLVDWIKDNYGKSSVPYNVEDFIVQSKLEYFHKSIEGWKQTARSIPFKYNERKLKLKGSLSLEKGNVDLSKVYSLLELEINEKHEYTDIIKYVTGENHKDTDAVRIMIEDTKDYEDYIEYTGVNYNKNNFLKRYKEEFEIAGNDCNQIDFLYEHAPNFIIDDRRNSHWKDIKTLASCSLNEWGTNEEKAIIKLINSIGKNNPTDLLDGLLKHKVGDENLFRVLYDKIQNYGGEDNFTSYIKILYKYWAQTDYKKQEIELFIPYNSEKKLGFYTDDFATFFNSSKNEVVITSRYNNSGYKYLGTFGFYSKVDLLNSNQAGEGLSIPVEVVPMFYLKALKDVNDTSNLDTGFSLTLDVVTTFTGVGNLLKLRHLRHLTKLQKGLKYTIAGAEIASGTLNAMLTISDCNTEFCKKLRVHLFWLEMGTLGLDAFTQTMIKKTAKKAFENADHTVDNLILEELAKVGDIASTGGIIKIATKSIAKSKLSKKFVDALKAMGKSEDDILEYFVKYHNDNDYRFFNEVKELTKKHPSLNELDTQILWGYTTNLFYENLNKWLRRSINLSKTDEMKKLLNSSLDKLENFKNPLIYRGIGRTGDASVFLNKYKPGVEETWDAFTSCGSSIDASFIGKADVIFEIKHLDAKDISDFADGIKFRGYPPHELLIKSGARFKVISNNKIDKLSGKPIIQFIQIK